MQYQYRILWAFGAPGANGPVGPLVFDGKGNLYGVTEGGGANNGGTVFELTPGANGQWTETIVYNFCSLPNCDDGASPDGVVVDGDENLYGTTARGGPNGQCADIGGCGTVFELTPEANGQWTESILWNFCSLPNCADGNSPSYPPTLGPRSVLYGIIREIAFQLTPGSNGWTFGTLYTFCYPANCPDGSGPSSSLTLDAKGNLYGVTAGGGTDGGGCVTGCGVAYVLRPQPGGQWQEAVLHSFQPDGDGIAPGGGATPHNHGLYGSTEAGGGTGCLGGGCGTVYQVTRGPSATTSPREQVLHSFAANGDQGDLPAGAVEFDGHGNLFGVTIEGGGFSCGCGVVYGMKPQGDGKWAFQVLHAFDGTDGGAPNSALTIDSQGNLYGAAGGGGPNGGGVIFELSPTQSASK